MQHFPAGTCRNLSKLVEKSRMGQKTKNVNSQSNFHSGKGAEVSVRKAVEVSIKRQRTSGNKSEKTS